jgi:nucleoside-diphosphate-sugar epimerase
MRVLLTGASGFIGRAALEALLERGHDVHAVARHPGEPRERVTWHSADLLQVGAGEALARELQASHLLHLAWYAVPGSFWNAPENERWIDASLRLLRAFGEAGGHRAVIAGTCAEYAWSDAVLHEQTTPLRPASLYGACKHATHVAASAAARQLGVSLGWGRIFFVYGPGEHPERLVAAVARKLLAGETVATTEGLQRRDFMHVFDVAGAFAELLRSDVDGAVNIASGEGATVREVITAVASAAGGLDRVRFGSRPQDPDEPPVIVGESARLSNTVGFEPTIGLAEGLADAVEWWRSAEAPFPEGASRL